MTIRNGATLSTGNSNLPISDAGSYQSRLLEPASPTSERRSARAAYFWAVIALCLVSIPLPASCDGDGPPKKPWISISEEVLAGKTAEPTTVEGNYVEVIDAPVNARGTTVHQDDLIGFLYTADRGKLRFKDYPGDEFVFVQEGSVTVTDEGTNKAQTFQAGDFFVVPKGWKGVWDMPGPYRELVMLSRGWGPAFEGKPVVSGMSKPVSPIRIDLQAGAAQLAPAALNGMYINVIKSGPAKSMTFHLGDYAVMLFDVPEQVKLQYAAYAGDQYVHVLGGHVTLTDAAGTRATFAAGDNFIVTRGFRGDWEAGPGYRAVAVVDRKHLEPVGGPATASELADPAELFAKRCITCHGGSFAPSPYQLGRLTADEAEGALWHGVMQEFAQSVDSGGRARLAQWIAGLRSDKGTRDSGVKMCGKDQPWKANPATDWVGRAKDNRFERHVADPAITVDRVAKTALKWALPLPNATAFDGAGNPVSVVGNRLFIANLNHWVYAIDAETGCANWTFRAEGRIRSNVALEDGILVFGDLLANAYALDAATGQLLWRKHVDERPMSRVTGNVTLHKGIVYVPISSLQELSGMRPDIPCCSFRGSVVALDARTGAVKWKTDMIDQPLRVLGKTAEGMLRYGPSGVPVFSAITADDKRSVVYVPTGNQMTEPQVAESDAMIALDMATGKKLWVTSLAPKQMGGRDIYHLGCEAWVDPARRTCSPENPKGEGDRDIVAPAVLTNLVDGSELLLAASKDGMFYALDPATGQVKWELRVGRGGELGGVEYGFAADGKFAYVPVSDANADFRADGTFSAIDLASGKIAWRVEGPTDSCKGKTVPPCSNAFLSPPTVAGEVVFTGSTDGFLRAYDRNNGKLVWSFDTVREYAGMNGAKGIGGSVSFGGPTVVGNHIYVMSGHGLLNIGIPGNVLLTFQIP